METIRRGFITSLVLKSWLCGGSWMILAAPSFAATQYRDFDVVIAGGSTAAFAAAIAAAESGARTALLEPTDWVGGQLTSSGVPAVDEAWHSIRDPDSGEVLLNVAHVARTPANMTPNLLDCLQRLEQPGTCWVSRFCFQPLDCLQQCLLKMQTRVGNRLVVFQETTVKHLQLDATGKRIMGLTAIRRFPRAHLAARGYDRPASQDLPDWYDPHPSDRFDKQVLQFSARDDGSTVFIEATEWGELLALAGHPYLQGADDRAGELEGNDRCGQAIVYDFVQEILPQPSSEVSYDQMIDRHGYGQYEGQESPWNQIWTYRRLRGSGPPSVGDLSLQNWGYSATAGHGGNDYPFGYFLLSRAEAARQRDDWQGGVDLAVLDAAERRAWGWHAWLKQHAPAPLEPAQIVLRGGVLGTAHGLAKLPYIRDTRRAIGLDGFLLRLADLAGPAAQGTGTRFDDRVALGAYPADIHPVTCCELPAEAKAAHHDTLPFYIPFRALTHQHLENLLTAGKTMAQSFLANSATRLHPIEWSSGTAAGVAAAWMSRERRTSRQAYQAIETLQDQIRRKTPIQWEGVTYQPPGIPSAAEQAVPLGGESNPSTDR
jgi:hypothetical protein